MTLSEIIDFLSKQDQSKEVPIGFDYPHSYRGYYERLAFEVCENTTVGAMLNAAKSALGNIYQGYKGGYYTMDGDTECYLAEYGCCGDGICLVLLRYMVGEV